jgi:hypothetical protein
LSDDEPARFAWEEDSDEVADFLWQHGYHHVRDFEGLWQHGSDGEFLTRMEAMEEIARRIADDEEQDRAPRGG